MTEVKLSVADQLAVDRTRLANQRTLLAFVRTFIIFLSSGLAIVQLNFLHDINYIGFALVGLSPCVLAAGLIGFFRMRKHIARSYEK